MEREIGEQNLAASGRILLADFNKTFSYTYFPKMYNSIEILNLFRLGEITLMMVIFIEVTSVLKFTNINIELCIQIMYI